MIGLPPRISAQDVQQIVANASGFTSIAEHLRSPQGKRDVPKAIVFVSSQLQQRPLMLYLAIGAWKHRRTREAMLWIQTTYSDVGDQKFDPFELRRPRLQHVNPMFETVPTVGRLRPDETTIFDKAESQMGLFMKTDVDPRFRTAHGPYFHVPGYLLPRIEQELRDMQRLQLQITQ